MVFFDGMLGGVLDPGGDARFNALAAVPDGFAREAFLLALRVATVFVSWMLSPMLLAGWLISPGSNGGRRRDGLWPIWVMRQSPMSDRKVYGSI